jgi:hypothetical protein
LRVGDVAALDDAACDRSGQAGLLLQRRGEVGEPAFGGIGQQSVVLAGATYSSYVELCTTRDVGDIP